jgi:hypothetical protein
MKVTPQRDGKFMLEPLSPKKTLTTPLVQPPKQEAKDDRVSSAPQKYNTFEPWNFSELIFGEFWKKLWPKEERKKFIVYNPPGYVPRINKRVNEKPVVTFFSWAFQLLPFFNFSEIIDNLIIILNRLLNDGRFRVIVRAHPMENPTFFIERWQMLFGALHSDLQLVKDEPLSKTLAQTDVALMFRSTVVLDCILNKIPVVMPGWIEYGYNEALCDLPLVYMAQDYQDLEQKIIEWLVDKPEISDSYLANYVSIPKINNNEFAHYIASIL